MVDLDALKGATIAFDLDGTLVESAPDLIAAINAVLVAENLKPLSLEEARPFVSRGARWLLQWGITSSEVPVSAARTSELFHRFLLHYSVHIAVDSHPFPGAIDALTVLRNAGAKLVVCTNKPTALAHSLLSKLVMVDFFDAIVGLDVVTAAKPDPAHLIEAVQTVGGDLKQAIMVGDADTDAGAARGAGTHLILVDFGYTEVPAAELAPDILLSHFDDLVDACIQLLK
ncbi:phosphoglycolate phosphatase [Acidovorax sp. Root275]|uniref:HAD-IA family hydrolase n=1 Tax=Acidovorax sp. Root275 TaxID=1736508 RepID=UPI00070EDAEB|nr:HAD-IA family hydrolase [Acidovorax sp. Root275]KRD55413.1 phosphoglycolate phosphatase [Acidovorax sp. Root275]